MDDSKHFREGPTDSVGLWPTGERLGDRIHERNGAGRVGADHSVADARKGDPQPF
jgi:hypothetical protein